MSLSIERMLEKFETGELSRRQFVAYLSSMAVIFAGVGKGIADSNNRKQTVCCKCQSPIILRYG